MEYKTSFTVAGVLDNLVDALLVLDGNGYVIYANQAAIAVTGFSRDQLLHQSLADFYGAGTDHIKATYELRQAGERGRFCTEGWRRRSDGGRFWGEWVLAPYTDETTGFRGFTCLLRDMSESKALALELRGTADRYRLMVEGVRDYAIFMLDAGGHVATWNEGARIYKGYRSNEIIGKHFSVFYTAEDLADGKPARELRIAVATGKYEEEGWRVRKDGSVFWASVVITALYNELNEFIGFSKVTRDLSERKRNEEILKQSEERYRSLVEQVIDYGIFMMDEQGRIISWNAGARRIKGYTAEEIIGKYFSIFYPEEDIISGKPAMELRVAKSQGKYEEEGWRLRKDGSYFWANVVITAVHNTEGQLIGFSKVTRDLTERKEAENALRESNERYRQLTATLRETNAELTAANGELEQFTSIVSHDLQEPIRTIKSFLQLIDLKLGTASPEELRVYSGKAIQASNRMRELIRNLLHYSQLGKAALAGQEVRVEEIVSQVLQSLRTALDISHAAVTVEADVETVFGDPIQLQQLLQNLVSNAIKFTAGVRPRIHIRCRVEDGRVLFSVTDNGIGIRNADLHKVFEIFRRLDTGRDYPGTGIGLAICKKIVDRHRGRIWPESEPGKGTTFYFTLNESVANQEAPL